MLRGEIRMVGRLPEGQMTELDGALRLHLAL